VVDKKKLMMQLSRVLRYRNFSPLDHILTILPELEPKDQVQACLKIMEYQYAKPAHKKKTTRKRQIKTIDGKVTDPKSDSPINIVELLDAASKKTKN